MEIPSSSSSSSSSESSAFTSDSDSDNNYVENVLLDMPRARLFRRRTDLFNMYDDDQFKLRYRLSKHTVIQLCDIIGDQLKSNTQRNKPLTAIEKILLTLRFYATGSFQQVLADHIHVSQPTISRVIPQVTTQIASLRAQFIKMPNTTNEMRKIHEGFHNIHGFPCVIGAIDGTHIRIQSPGGEHAELYRNRKGWFSYNVQCVCDAKLQFMDIIARWPGSVHDSTIFFDSPLRVDFEDNKFSNNYLLGDSGYALKPYLLTPVLNPTSNAEKRYNAAHIHTRNTIERAFGVWKRRFPCLALGMRLKRETVLHIIIATAVLHNLCIILQDDDFGVDVIEDAGVEVGENENDNNNALNRNIIINNIFA